MKTLYQRFWLLLAPDRKDIYQVYTYALFKGVIALSLPVGIQSIINLIQGGSVSKSWMLLVFIVVLGVALGGYLQFMQMRISETIQQRIFTRAAFDFTYRIPKIKFEEIYNHFPPELMNRFFDVMGLQKSLSKIIIEFPTAILQIVFGLILLSLYHPFFILFSILLIIIVFSIIRFTSIRGLQTGLEESKYKYKVVSWLEELARSKDSFKLAGTTNLPELKTDERVTGYLVSRESHFRVLQTQYMWLVGFKVVIALALLVVGGLLVLEQQMNIGQFVAAEIIILLVLDSSEKLILHLDNVYDILVSLEKVGQVTDLGLVEQSNTSSLNHHFSAPMKVELVDLSFTYPGRSRQVLKSLNYEFKEGFSYCIKGNNGSGKSTLLHAISGLYKPSSGNVCINGFPVNNYHINELYKAVGNGLSEETIFEGSISDNITLGRDYVGIEDVEWAISKVNLGDFIKSFPKGIDTPLDPSGQKLSKSIIQRIIIARSIVNRPKLLLLESHIDFIEESDRKKIIEFLFDKSNGWTLISISNDPYLQSKADVIVEMKDGKIV